MTDLTAILGAINSALGVVKTVAETPGVNVLPYASTVASAIGALQAAEAAGKNLLPYITAITDTFAGGVPDQSKLDAINATIAELEQQVDAPLPAAEDGEPA